MHEGNSRAAARLAAALPLLAIGSLVASADRAAAASRYLGPVAAAASPDGDVLYVACADAGQVLWVARDGRVLRRAATPGRPTDVLLTPDGQRLIGVCAAPQSVVLVWDAATGRRLQQIPAGHTASGAALAPDGRRLYVCNRFDDDLSVIDLEAGRELRRAPAVRQPVAAAVTPDGKTLLVANHLPRMRANVPITGSVYAAVTAIDTATFAAQQIELPSGSISLRDLCLTADGRYALATHLMANFQEQPFRVDMGWINTNVVSVIDVARRKWVASIGLDQMDRGAANPWGVALSRDGRWVGVALSGTHELALIRTDELLSEHARRTMQPMMGVWPIYLSLGGSLWRRIPLPGKGPRGVAAAGGALVAAQYFSDSLAVVGLDEEGAAGQPQPVALGPPPQLTLARRGELLFHDGTICYQDWQSCASCHPDGREDGLNWDLMNDGIGNPKNTKSLLYSHRTPPAMARAVRATAEEAVRAGITFILFEDRPESEAAAIDAYLKSLRPTPSPHLVNGRLSEAAERGRRLFHNPRVGCARCHPPPLFTDRKQHDLGTALPFEIDGRIDTPTLIETWRTAPYLHDGRYVTVRELLQEGRHGSPPGGLSQQQVNDLAEYVLSL